MPYHVDEIRRQCEESTARSKRRRHARGNYDWFVEVLVIIVIGLALAVIVIAPAYLPF